MKQYDTDEIMNVICNSYHSIIDEDEAIKELQAFGCKALGEFIFDCLNRQTLNGNTISKIPACK